MKISQVGIDLIKEFEGCKLKTYVCPAGKKTVGYGHVLPDDTDITEISQDTADKFLEFDIRRFEEVLNKDLATYIYGLSQNQYDAIISLMFNIGSKNWLRSTLRDYVRNGNLREAEKEFSAWVWAAGKKLPGLERRRKAEAALFAKDTK